MTALFSLLLLLIILGLIAYTVRLRADLLKMNNSIDKSFADIDRLLKQRHDELPKLVETCRAYLEYEQKTLQSVVEGRNVYARATTPSQKAQADHLVSDAVRNLLAVAAKNPDLKRSTSFVQLQTRIAQLEEKVAAQRDRYNEDVKSFNARIARVPHAIAARLAKVRARELFQASKAN
jgi:LemA protein